MAPYSLVNLLKSSLRLTWAIFFWALTKKNTEAGYHALIRLHLKTRGKTTRVIFWLIRKLNPPLKRNIFPGLLSEPSDREYKKIQKDLEDKGFHILKQPLPDQIIQELKCFSLQHPGLLRANDKDPIGSSHRKIRYIPGQPEGVRYEFLPEDLMKVPAAQKIFFDPFFLNIARNYLKTEPIIDIVAMWWHTDYQKTPDSNAAQFFHFDMDRVRWLKFFFYITDVTTDSGPHCFVEGTHNVENVPQTLLEKGYVRLTDEDMEAHFDKSKFIEFTGKAGTIIVEDTAGFHKGKHVHKGDRLVFQLEYAVSMFGTPSSQKFPIDLSKAPELTRFKKELPRASLNLQDVKSDPLAE